MLDHSRSCSIIVDYDRAVPWSIMIWSRGPCGRDDRALHDRSLIDHDLIVPITNHAFKLVQGYKLQEPLKYPWGLPYSEHSISCSIYHYSPTVLINPSFDSGNGWSWNRTPLNYSLLHHEISLSPSPGVPHRPPPSCPSGAPDACEHCIQGLESISEVWFKNARRKVTPGKKSVVFRNCTVLFQTGFTISHHNYYHLGFNATKYQSLPCTPSMSTIRVSGEKNLNPKSTIFYSILVGERLTYPRNS